MPALEDYKIKTDHFFEVVTRRAVAALAEDAETNQSLLGVSDEAIEKYYEIARGLLDENNWFDARDAFLFLSFLNPLVHEYWVGLGIAEQSQSKFQQALMAYIMAEATNSENPVPPANAFQCAVALNELDFALYSLDKAITCCGDKPEFSELKEKLLSYKK